MIEFLTNLPPAAIVTICFIIAGLLSALLIKTAKLIIKIIVFIVVFYILLKFGGIM